jgi:hypothetical protein
MYQLSRRLSMKTPQIYEKCCEDLEEMLSEYWRGVLKAQYSDTPCGGGAAAAAAGGRQLRLPGGMAGTMSSSSSGSGSSGSRPPELADLPGTLPLLPGTMPEPSSREVMSREIQNQMGFPQSQAVAKPAKIPFSAVMGSSPHRLLHDHHRPHANFLQNEHPRAPTAADRGSSVTSGSKSRSTTLRRNSANASEDFHSHEENASSRFFQKFFGATETESGRIKHQQIENRNYDRNTNSNSIATNVASPQSRLRSLSPRTNAEDFLRKMINSFKTALPDDYTPQDVDPFGNGEDVISYVISSECRICN